jgi:hypothetical protein
MFGGAFYECCFSAAPALSLFDGTVTGAILIGYGAGVSSPIDGAYFRSTDGGNWFAVTRENGNETFTDTGVAPTLGTFRNFRIQVEADRSAVRFYIDGTLVATHTTNIPIATRGLSHVFTVNRVAAVATAVGMDLDFLWTRRVLSADRWS